MSGVNNNENHPIREHFSHSQVLSKAPPPTPALRLSDTEAGPWSSVQDDKAAKSALTERCLLKQSGEKTSKLNWASLQKPSLKAELVRELIT